MNPLKPFVAALRRLGLPFTVVGSVASSARGIPRATRNVDLVVRLAVDHAYQLAASLGAEWYSDALQIQQAIRSCRSFNVIHMETGWKIDVFPAWTDFHDSELKRATITPVLLEGEEAECPVSSAEDVLLAKLRWYRDGGEISERQWSDIAGVMETNPRMDTEYLLIWAGRLGVTTLLDRALSERDSA